MTYLYLYSQLKEKETTFFKGFAEFIENNNLNDILRMEAVESLIGNYILTFGPHKILLRSQIGLFTNYISIHAYLICEHFGKDLKLEELKESELIYNPAQNLHIIVLKSKPNMYLPHQFYQTIIETLKTDLEKIEQGWLTTE